MPTDKEIYCRFNSEKFGPGVHENPCLSLEDAAETFANDHDCISAFEITLDDRGCVISARDVTEDIFKILRSQIENDVYATCPHPDLEDVFTSFRETQEREAEEDREHERIESAMIHI